MQKPTSLRKALTAALPELREQPDRLVIWVEDGAVRARQTESHGFAFEYPLSVLLTQVKTDVAQIAHAINRWSRVNQPDLLRAGSGNSYSFETDILDNDTADVVFTIPLTENVSVTQNQDESWQIEYQAEPDPLFTDASPALPLQLDDTPPLTGVDTIVADD
ncbi:phage tail protein [Erythrobacter sp. EC-HK427]|uniref:phage tail protein n=1 Tax=Erythrobacter sp. EC-HK427 TaxID=2038396 RepID=UPI00125A6F0A|nr:phage tail protein [Erythrobacter sp. EC-HK427]VVT07442.1 Phage tail protein [Erythrobacter sp. EC-HK427]